MKATLKDGFVGGLLASAVWTGALAMVVGVGVLLGEVGVWGVVSGASLAGLAFSTALGFIVMGALWAIPFAAFAPDPTVCKGIAFAFLPALWNWVVLPALLMDGPLLDAIPLAVLTVLLPANCLVWGGIVGWYCAHRARPVTT